MEQKSTLGVGWTGLIVTFISGSVYLAFALLAQQILCARFGATPFVVGTILVAGCVGIGAGAVVLGRKAPSLWPPFQVYAALQVVIGCFACALPLAVQAIATPYDGLYRNGEPGVSAQAVLALGILCLILPPAFAVGGSFAVISRILPTNHSEPARSAGRLFSVASLGAGVGGWLTFSFLLTRTGIQNTLFVAGGLAIATALLSFFFGRVLQPLKQSHKSRHEGTETAEARPDASATLPVRWTMVTLALAGFCFLSYQALWVRVLAQVQGPAIDHRAWLLLVVGLGATSGSYLASRARLPALRRAPLSSSAAVSLMGLSSLLVLWFLSRLPAIDATLSSTFDSGNGFQQGWIRFVAAMVGFFLPAFFMGMTFSSAAVICLQGGLEEKRRAGHLIVALAAGAGAGVFITSIVLRPLLGTQSSLLLLFAVNMLAGVLPIASSASLNLKTRVLVAISAILMSVIPFFIFPSKLLYNTFGAGQYLDENLYFKETFAGTVSVDRGPDGDRRLSVDGLPVAGDGYKMRSIQKLRGYIPLGIHPHPKSVLQLGLGGGESIRAGLALGAEAYTVVDADPAMLEAVKQFEEINQGSYRDPRVRHVRVAPEAYVRFADETYDIVASSASTSRLASQGTVEFLRDCARRLRPGGLFVYDIPLNIRPAEFQIILAGFQDVFPHISFWVASNCIQDRGILIGGLAPLKIDFARLQDALQQPGVAEDLASIEIQNVFDLLDCHMLDGPAITSNSRWGKKA